METTASTITNAIKSAPFTLTGGELAIANETIVLAAEEAERADRRLAAFQRRQAGLIA